LTSIQSPFPAWAKGDLAEVRVHTYLGVSFALRPLCSCQSPLGPAVSPAKSKSTTGSAARQPRRCRRFQPHLAASALRCLSSSKRAPHVARLPSRFGALCGAPFAPGRQAIRPNSDSGLPPEAP